MSLFVCEECRSVENTALSNFWIQSAKKERRLCSACDPAIGKWHGRFDRKTYDGQRRVQWADGEWVS